ncbi:hypothetical protein K3495_g1849 [Podosphaera aphanis]|nr:hypothetical protein K3495_g1849 [Podosphaera aphanis]
MLISLSVGKVDAGVAVLLTQDKRLIEFPSILLPPNISSGSIVDITVSRNFLSEQKSAAAFLSLQDSIYASFGVEEPVAPVLRCRNATQTSVVLEWNPIELATADIISLSLFRNGQKAGNIPRPDVTQSTKISGLGVDTEYVFHLMLRTTAGTFSSDRVAVKTHKMTDLSGITVTPGILPAQLRDSLTRAVERIGAKMADTVRIDTTHFVTTEGHGVAWEKAVEMNIPVVRPEWVEGCERGGRIVGVRQYYLDADPGQRQIVTNEIPILPKDPVKDYPMPSPPFKEHINGASQASHPTPPLKERNKYGDDSSGDEESEVIGPNGNYEVQQQVGSEEYSKNSRTTISHRTAARAESISSSEEDTSTEREDEQGEIDEVIPGNSSFQNIAL